MKTQIRIVAGSLRGRKLTCFVHPDLRPTPQMVREAYFSILGNAIPGRPFVDLFAGTGVIGMEALSRGAENVSFVERDFRHAQDIENHLEAFDLKRRAKIFRSDVYRWVAAWQPPSEPVNIFVSPPFRDLTEKPEDLLQAIELIQSKIADDSVLVVQSERGCAIEEILKSWETRRYGRNTLLLWQRGSTADESTHTVTVPDSPSDA